MPTSSAIPPPAVDQSPAASDSDEYEYEEIEIEEEIEVEEEVSDDEEGEGEEEEEEEQDDEEEEKESGEEKSPSIDNVDDQKRKSTPISGNDKASQCDGPMMSAVTSNPFKESSKEVTGGVSVNSLIESNKTPHSEEETMQTCAKDVNDAKQMEPRLDVPLIRPRSLSPAVEIEDGNKRPALICEFFAKGWCIKGNSCRFRHIRDSMNAGDQKNECSVAAYQKSEHQEDEGIREGIGRSGLATSAAAPATTCSPELMQLQESKESPKNENPGTIASFDDVGTKGILENRYLDKDNHPVKANGSLETSRNMFMNSDINRSNWVSSYATSTEYQFGIHNHKFPNYSSSSFESSRFSPSSHSSIWPRTSTLLGSSWNSDSFSTLKHVGGDREHRPSLRPTVFSLSGSESERLYHNNEAPLHSAGFTTKFSTYDWEPSKPFRSSFLISQGISSPGSQYDPIRDSIEPPKIGDKFPKISSNQAPSISSTHSPMKVNQPQKETFGMDYGSDRFSLASNANSNDNAVDVHSNAYEFTSEKGAVDTKQENSKSEGKGKKHPTPVHVRDVIQASELHVNHNFMGQSDGPRKEIIIGDDGSQYHKSDFDAERDDAMHRESKALKHFRAALIEFVKELVKPTWREGKLSKDAHKIIVKKAVDRVLSAFPAEHIPTMQESINMYLSSSQPKIMKLVEGYIEKYGKL